MGHRIEWTDYSKIAKGREAGIKEGNLNPGAYRPYTEVVSIWSDEKEASDPELRFGKPEESSTVTETASMWEDSDSEIGNYGSGSTTPNWSASTIRFQFRWQELAELQAIVSRFVEAVTTASIDAHSSRPSDIRVYVYLKGVQYKMSETRLSDGSRIYVADFSYEIQASKR